MTNLGLSDAVDTAETLLDPVRVPRQVVVHHQVGTLQVDALACGVRGDEHLHFGIVLEGLLHLQRSSRPMPPWMTTTALSRPSSVVMRVYR